VLKHPGLTPLRYNTGPQTLLNPFFIVCANIQPAWSEGLLSE
jgi:3'(2'), 5'-bisphosphate nucleotidase